MRHEFHFWAYILCPETVIYGDMYKNVKNILNAFQW